MHNLWLVARHEYRKRIAQRSFLLASLGISIGIIAIMAISIAVSMNQQNAAVTVGYVDEPGLLAGAPSGSSPGGRNRLIRYPGMNEARAALERGEVEVFYVLPPDYLQTRQVRTYYREQAPSNAAQQAFAAYVRAGLAASLPEGARHRLVEGPRATLRSWDGARQASARDAAGIIVPFMVAFFFVFVAITSASYMLQVVSDEKENRMVEILATSLTPEQIIGGKALGLMGVALTQMLIWLLATVAALLVGAPFLDFLRGARLPWDTLLVSAWFFFPAYALIAGVMTAIGSATTDSRQAQQIAGLLNLFFILPLFFAALIFVDPNNTLMVALTLFPTTSFVTVSLRWGLTAIPLWQLLLGWALLCASAVLSVWAAARIFRAGMLRYGQPLSLHGALAALGWRS